MIERSRAGDISSAGLSDKLLPLPLSPSTDVLLSHAGWQTLLLPALINLRFVEPASLEIKEMYFPLHISFKLLAIYDTGDCSLLAILYVVKMMRLVLVIVFFSCPGGLLDVTFVARAPLGSGAKWKRPRILPRISSRRGKRYYWRRSKISSTDHCRVWPGSCDDTAAWCHICERYYMQIKAPLTDWAFRGCVTIIYIYIYIWNYKPWKHNRQWTRHRDKGERGF